MTLTLPLDLDLEPEPDEKRTPPPAVAIHPMTLSWELTALAWSIRHRRVAPIRTKGDIADERQMRDELAAWLDLLAKAAQALIEKAGEA